MNPIVALGGAVGGALAKARGRLAAKDRYEVCDMLTMTFLVVVTVGHWFPH